MYAEEKLYTGIDKNLRFSTRLGCIIASLENTYSDESSSHLWPEAAAAKKPLTYSNRVSLRHI